MTLIALRQFKLLEDMPMSFHLGFWVLTGSRQKLKRFASLKHLKWLLSFMAIAAVCELKPVQAQTIIPDSGANGTGTLVTPSSTNVNQLNITGGQLSGGGANLFHSLQRFGLNPNQIANFVSQPEIRNILTRIVGGEASNIYGKIQVTGGNSNLYLMNPAGILFGPSATVNVPASFTATTANGIGFGTNAQGFTWFSATDANNYKDPALNGAPTTFGFTMSQPAAIVNLATMVVGTADKVRGTSSLTLAGGTVVNAGDLTAIPGNQQIRLAAVTGQKLVQLVPNPQGGLQWNILDASSTNNLPQAWILPTLDLPRLLTGGNIGQATNLKVNADGSIQLRVQPDGTVKFFAPKGSIKDTSGTTFPFDSSELVVGTGVVSIFVPNVEGDDFLKNYLLYPAFINQYQCSTFPCGTTITPDNTANIKPIPNTSILGFFYEPLPLDDNPNSIKPVSASASKSQSVNRISQILGICPANLPQGCSAPETFGSFVPPDTRGLQDFPSAISSPLLITPPPPITSISNTTPQQPASNTPAPSNPIPSNPAPEKNLQPQFDAQINTVLSCNSSQNDSQSSTCSRANQPVRNDSLFKTTPRNGDRILQIIDGSSNPQQR